MMNGASGRRSRDVKAKVSDGSGEHPARRSSDEKRAFVQVCHASDNQGVRWPLAPSTLNRTPTDACPVIVVGRLQGRQEKRP